VTHAAAAADDDDVIQTTLGESYAKELRKISLADNTVRRRISDISEDVCDQLKVLILHCL